jgi:hypothetical protein
VYTVTSCTEHKKGFDLWSHRFLVEKVL